MKRLYLAGPMRGLPEFNFPAFFEAERHLMDLGYVVENPARVDDEQGVPWRGAEGTLEELAEQGFDICQTMALDLEIIALRCDAVCVLPGWDKSSGARAEAALAQAIGIPIVALGFSNGSAPGLYEIEVTLRATVGERPTPVLWAEALS